MVYDTPPPRAEHVSEVLLKTQTQDSLLSVCASSNTGSSNTRGAAGSFLNSHSEWRYNLYLRNNWTINVITGHLLGLLQRDICIKCVSPQQVEELYGEPNACPDVNLRRSFFQTWHQLQNQACEWKVASLNPKQAGRICQVRRFGNECEAGCC